MTLQASKILQSDRLIYRAVEESDDPFLLELHREPQSHLNTTPFFPVPQAKKVQPSIVNTLQVAC